jgi:acetolactate synthase-1/2/3 large subunit
LFHVDVDAHVPGRAYPQSSGIVADASDYLDGLIAYAEACPPGPHVEARRSYLQARLRERPRWLQEGLRSSAARPLKPQRLMSELQHVLDHDPQCAAGVNLFCDVGNVLGWAWHHLVIGWPNSLFCNTTMGAMGWASGAVIGAKLGEPEKPALALVGDGALLMNGVEISSAAQAKVGAIWIVLYDNSMSMVAQGMGVTHADLEHRDWRAEYDLGSPDLAAFARSLGADAVDICGPGQLQHELGLALARSERRSVPQVLVAHIDHEEKPPFEHLREELERRESS